MPYKETSKLRGYVVIIKRRANSKQVTKLNRVFKTKREAINNAILTA